MAKPSVSSAVNAAATSCGADPSERASSSAVTGPSPSSRPRTISTSAPSRDHSRPAQVSGAVIVGFNVIPDEAARNLADARQVEVRRYDIIYKLTDDIKLLVEGKLKPEERIVEMGTALVKQVFTISRVGSVAGCQVIRGSIERNGRIRVSWKLARKASGTVLNFEWTESGLDTPPAISHEGFGHEMLLRSLPYDLGAETRLEFSADGMCFTMNIPIGPDVLAEPAG